MKDIPILLKAARKYEIMTGNRRSTAAAYAVGDARFFDHLQDGGGCTVKRFNTAFAWLIANTPTAKTARKPVPKLQKLNTQHQLTGK